MTPAVLLAPLLVLLAPAVAPQDGFEEREVRFGGEEATLAGTLLVPSTDEPAPAIVFLHGSGPTTRAGFRPYAEEYARLGIASLAYDKRGTGASSGELRSPFEDLTEDALAAVAYLCEQPGVDPERVGFWGISQGGWIATLAAARSPDVAFLVVISGGGAGPRDSELFSWARELESAGLAEEQRSAAMDVVRAYFAYLESGEGRAELDARLARVAAGTEPGLEELSPEHRADFVATLGRVLPAHEDLGRYRPMVTYEPLDDLATLRIPMLVLLGERDRDHPTALAAERWREGAARAGNERLSLVVFPGAGHGIRMREGHRGPGRAPFADGYHEVLAGWLWRHVVDAGR